MKRREWRIAIVLVALAIGQGASLGQTATNDSALGRPKLITEYNLPGLDKPFSLAALQSMDVVTLIQFLAKQGGLNVVVGRDVTGTMKLALKDVALGEALEVILAVNGLAYEVKGGIIKVMTEKEYLAQYGQGFYEQRQAKVVQLQYATPSSVAAMLAEVKSQFGKVVFDSGTGTLVLFDTPEKIRAMEAVIAKTETLSTETQSFALQYTTPEEIQAEITALLTKEIGKMQADKRTKTLVVTDLPHKLARISEVIALFDRPPKQVFLEAKIVQIELKNDFSLGVRWDHVMEFVGPRFSLETASQFPLGLGAEDSKGTLSYKTIAGGGDLNVVLDALETMGKTKILSNPHIAALDGQEANIKAVVKQPYSELKYESGTTNVTGKSYTFVEVGVTLSVTPRISDDGFIQVSIKPEVSSISDWYDSDVEQRGVPVVRTALAETTVSVKDGVTIIIAGMIEERESATTTGLPVLSRIPFLGALFRSKGTSAQNVETVVFLTPKIVSGAEPFLRSRDLKSPKKNGGDLSRLNGGTL